MRFSPVRPPLRHLVRTIWASAPGRSAARRELVLPTGDVHLVLRLGERPLRLFNGAHDPEGRTVSTSVVGGARAVAYCRAVEPDCAAVGVLLAPGACRMLIGVPAGALAGQHVALADIWPEARVASMRERLAAAEIGCRPGLMAAMLGELAGDGDGPDAAVMAGLRALRAGARVEAAAEAAGLSRRHFGRRFAEEMGLSPRDWVGTRRFNRLLGLIHGGREPLADVAMAGGFADQPHMSRAFAEVAGLTPGVYRRIGPIEARHVPIDTVQGFMAPGFMAPGFMAQGFKTGGGETGQERPAT